MNNNVINWSYFVFGVEICFFLFFHEGSCSSLRRILSGKRAIPCFSDAKSSAPGVARRWVFLVGEEFGHHAALQRRSLRSEAMSAASSRKEPQSAYLGKKSAHFFAQRRLVRLAIFTICSAASAARRLLRRRWGKRWTSSWPVSARNSWVVHLSIRGALLSPLLHPFRLGIFLEEVAEHRPWLCACVCVCAAAERTGTEEKLRDDLREFVVKYLDENHKKFEELMESNSEQKLNLFYHFVYEIVE